MSNHELAAIKERIREVTQKLIRELRAGEHLTQTELAKRMKINRSLISQYESGDREPSLWSLLKLADYAHVSVDYLLGRKGSHKYQLTRPEEHLVEVCRKVPPGYEMVVIKKEGSEEEQKDYQIRVKQEVEI